MYHIQLDEIRKIIVNVRRSAVYQGYLKEECTSSQVPYHKSIIDVKARWNNTYLMINSAITLKQLFQVMTRHNDVPPVEWATLEELRRLLQDVITTCDNEIKQYYSRIDDVAHGNICLVLDPRSEFDYHRGIDWDAEYIQAARTMNMTGTKAA
ncbi:unnamed protein product [Absidia cylindrospora]